MFDLKEFINFRNFPCVMAKSVLKKGHLENYRIEDSSSEKELLNYLYLFIDHFRNEPHKLHSCIFEFPCFEESTFERFESYFWNLLEDLSRLDKQKYRHDKRVSSSFTNSNYSYSLKEEAFFIVMLHPESPRLSRRYSYPAIVFNPHEQFENLRKANKYQKIKNIIRKRDQKVQGNINPMLSDFGEVNELFQYTGRDYSIGEVKPPWIQDIREELIYGNYSA